jgi:hypothetical protein
MALVWTAWKSGSEKSATDYGLRVPIADRDRLFDKRWQTVVLELPAERGFAEFEVSIAKASFWTAKCHELISKDIACWLRASGLMPWPTHRPPRLLVEETGSRRFRVAGVANYSRLFWDASGKLLRAAQRATKPARAAH